MWWKKSRRVSLLIIASLLVVLPPISNEVTRRIAVGVLGSLVDGRATIKKVRLGLGNIRVEQVRAWSSNCDQPVLALNKLDVSLSLWDGIRNGVWTEKIVFDRPEIQLNFDEHGKLITTLPLSQSDQAGAEPMRVLPFRGIEVRKAIFAIHQTGRNPFRLADVGIDIDGDGSTFEVSVLVPAIFEGKVLLQSRFDIVSSTASSCIQVNNLRVASGQLVRLPMVPQSVDAQSWTAATSFEIHQDGSFADLRNLSARAVLHEVYVSMGDRARIMCASGECHIAAGRFESNLAGSLMGGTFGLASQAGLGENIKGEFQMSCVGLKTDALPSGLLPKEVSTRLDAELRLKGTYLDRFVELAGNADAEIPNANAFGVQIAPTKLQIEVDGGIDLSQSPSRSRGEITATIISDGVSLEQLSYTGLHRLPSIGSQSDIHTHVPKLPSYVQPSGQVRAAATCRVPIATIRAPNTYFAKGIVDTTGVVVNNMRVENGQVSFAFENNSASAIFDDLRLVDQVSAQVSSVSAKAHTNLDANSRLKVEGSVNRLSAATIARLAGVIDREIDGEFIAHTVVACPLLQLADLEKWRGQAVIQARSIRADYHRLAHFEAACNVGDGRITLERIVGELAGGQLRATGLLELQSPFPFRFEGGIQHLSLSQTMSIAGQSSAEIVGSIDAAVQATGTLDAHHWQANGQLLGSRLQFGSREFDDTQLNFDASPASITVEAPAKEFLGGDLRFEIAQLKEVTGQIRELPLATLARLAGTGERIDGHVTCEFQANMSTDLTRMNASAVLVSPGIVVRDMRTNQVRANFQLQDGQALAEVGAIVLGGQLALRANANVEQLIGWNMAESRAISELPVNAIAAMDGVELADVWSVIGQQNELRHLRGTVSAIFERGSAELQQGKVAVGEFKLHDLRWDNVLWSNQLQARVALGDRLAEIRQLSGPFAGGQLSGRGKIVLDGSNTGSFEVSAERVSLRKALVPVSRQGELADGLVSLRANGRLGSRPSGRALVSIDRGTAGPIAFARMRVPVEWSVDPRAKMAQWRTTNAGLELGGGRVVTNAEGRWNGKLDLKLAASARRVDTGRVLSGRATPGSGYLDGTFRLNAKQALDASDFVGTFDATLSEASSLKFPIVSDLAKFLKTIPTTTSFDESRIQGRLGNGIVHVDRVTLSAANAQVLAEGTATLQGRLNLQVMAKTGDVGPADKLLELADSPLLMAAPTPIGLVAKANAALKDRVVHLRIGGTAARPVIRMEPGRQIGQEAVKFFMNQAIAFRNNDELSFR